MSENPFVSIVIPTLGTVSHIRGLLCSMAELDYPQDRFEVIILGDTPTKLLEGCAKRAREAGVAVRLEYEPVPAGEKRNRGVALAQGEIIAFTDDDTILRADWLTRGVAHLRENPEHVGVGGPNFTPPEELPFAQAVGRIFGSRFLFSFRYTIGHRKPREIDHNPTCNYLLWKRVVEQVQFHPTLWPGEDVEFDIRLLQAGHRILYAPDVVVWHHRRPRPRAFLQQMYSYGVTRAQVTRMHPRSFDPRHYAFVFAFAFLMALYGVALRGTELSYVGTVPWQLPAALNLLYFTVLGLAGLLVGWQTRAWKQGAYAPVVLFLQHFGYSLGLLVGLVKRP